MTKPKGYDLFLSSNNEVKASAVETYMRSSGWIPKAETQASNVNEDQETEDQPAKADKKEKVASRQKGWVPWPKA